MWEEKSNKILKFDQWRINIGVISGLVKYKVNNKVYNKNIKVNKPECNYDMIVVLEIKRKVVRNE